MTNKTSPQSRPTAKRRTRRASASNTPPRSDSSRSPHQRAAPTWRTRLRRFAPAILLPDAAVALLIVIIAFGGLLLSGQSLAFLPVTIGEMWMITVLAPVIVEDVTVSYLPLLPALGLIALVAGRVRRTVREKVSMVDLGVLAACAVVIPLVFSVIAWFMVWDASRVFDVSAAPMWQVLLQTVIVHVIALALGMGPQLWREIFRRYTLPAGLIDGAVLARQFFQRLGFLAAVVLVVLAIVRWREIEEMFAAYPTMTAAGITGLILLTLLYLPNALIAAGAVLLGAEFHMGQASVSLFSIHLVPLPPMPLTALIPGTISVWAPLLLLATALIAAWVMITAKPDAWQAAGAALGAGLIGVVSAYLAHGQLGGYGATGPMIWLTGLLALVWLGAVGFATFGALWLAQRRQPAEEVEPEPAEEPADVEEAVDVEEAAEAEEAVEAEPIEAEAEDVVAEEPAAENPPEETVSGEEDADAREADSDTEGEQPSSQKRGVDSEE